jgi:hypothetical protein
MIIFNTHYQLRAAGGGFAITWHSKRPRSPIGAYWAVIRYMKDQNGVLRQYKTDPQAPWYHHGCKVFGGFQSKTEALAEAKQWCEDNYAFTGKWARNKQGDYLPVDINKKFPIRD